MAEDSENRFDQGMAYFRKSNPEAAQQLVAALENFAPDVIEMVGAFGFGAFCTRDGLDPKTRQTVVLTTLATKGALPQLKMHLNIAKSMGFTKEEIVEILMQLIPYTGFPTAINAIMVAREVFGDDA